MIKFLRFVKGILLKPTTYDASHDEEGAIYVDDSDNTLRSYLGGSTHVYVDRDSAEELQNKTINAANNTITGIGSGEITDNSIPNSKMVDEAELDEAVTFFSNTDISGAEAETLTDIDRDWETPQNQFQ